MHYPVCSLEQVIGGQHVFTNTTALAGWKQTELATQSIDQYVSENTRQTEQ